MSKHLQQRRAAREGQRTRDARKQYEEMDRERMVRAHYDGIAAAEKYQETQESDNLTKNA